MRQNITTTVHKYIYYIHNKYIYMHEFLGVGFINFIVYKDFIVYTLFTNVCEPRHIFRGAVFTNTSSILTFTYNLVIVCRNIVDVPWSRCKDCCSCVVVVGAVVSRGVHASTKFQDGLDVDDEYGDA